MGQLVGESFKKEGIYTYIHIYMYICIYIGFPGGSEVKASAWNTGDPGSIPQSGRSPGEGNDICIELIHFVVQQKLTTLLSTYTPIKNATY